jgi:tetratricopeptide (TPR) repeat protein
MKRVERKQGSRNTAPAARVNNIWIYVGLAVAILAVYAQVATHEFINYDDPAYVMDNPHVRDGFTREGVVWAFTSAHDSNWIPLTWLSHMLDCQLFGLQSGLHHVTSVVLHAISTLLLFALLRKITGARWPSAFVAFVFGVHPLHVESVAWIAERKDVLSALFWMLTLWAYVRYVEQRSVQRYVVVALLFCCALMAKPMAVTLPVTLLLPDLWPLRRFSRGAMLEKVPLGALSVAAMAIAFVAQKQGGAVAELNAVPLFDRIENALLSYAIYIWKLMVPINLAVFYPYFAIPAWQWILAGLAIVGGTFLVIREIPVRPYLAMGWFWYVVTLLPVIGLVQIGGQARADRYTYIPMIGISIMLAWGCAELYDRAKPAIRVVSIAACVAWLALAWVNVEYWQNSMTLFQHAIEVTDANYVAYTNLGSALRHAGRVTEAITDFEIAARIRPDDADVQDNFGEALVASGRLAEAMPHLQEAARLRPESPKAHVDLAAALMRGGRVEDAAAEYRAALRLEPGRIDAQYGLGGVLARQGRMQEAIPYLQAALPYLSEQVRIKPDDPDPHYNLGLVYAILERSADAIAEFSATVRLEPDNPESHYNLGVAFASSNRFEDAFGELSTAVRLRPEYVEARVQLANVLFRVGRPAEASSHLKEALRIDPKFPEARAMADKLGWP